MEQKKGPHVLWPPIRSPALTESPTCTTPGGVGTKQRIINRADVFASCIIEKATHSRHALHLVLKLLFVIQWIIHGGVGKDGANRIQPAPQQELTSENPHTLLQMIIKTGVENIP